MTAIAYVTRLGYLHCSWCAMQRDYDHQPAPVYKDSSPHNSEYCDCCQQPVLKPQPIWHAS
jgi:NAD-dependent SIR2 family protein deacetylase